MLIGREGGGRVGIAMIPPGGLLSPGRTFAPSLTLWGVTVVGAESCEFAVSGFAGAGDVDNSSPG